MTSNEQRRTLPPLVHPAAAAVPEHKTLPLKVLSGLKYCPGMPSRARLSLGPPRLSFFFLSTRAFVTTCLMFVLLTFIYPRSFYLSEYENLTAVCQSLTAVPNYG